MAAYLVKDDVRITLFFFIWFRKPLRIKGLEVAGAEFENAHLDGAKVLELDVLKVTKGQYRGHPVVLPEKQ
jgi:hypothetical protein